MVDLRALHFQTHDAIDHAFPRFFGTWYSHFDIFTFHVFVSGRRKLPQAPCAVQIQCLGGAMCDGLAWVGDVRHISNRFKYGIG